VTHDTVPEMTVRFFPAPGEIFELMLDGDALDPMEMVRADGYHPEEGWKFNGPRIEGFQARRFKLTRVGYCRNLDEVKKRVKVAGEKLAEGQWREAFKFTYPRPDRDILIGFGGSKWVFPDGSLDVPFLDALGVRWHSGFRGADGSFDGRWYWLVKVK